MISIKRGCLNVIGFAALATLGVSLNGCGSDAASSDFQSYFASGLAIASPTAGSGSKLNKLSAVKLFSEVDSDLPIDEKAAVFEEIAKATSLAACQFSLPNLGMLGQNATCYGPNVSYDTIEGSGAGSLPGGDLGIWEEAEAGGTACAAAQLNSIAGSTSSYMDASLMLQAASLCVLTNAGKAFPAKGESVTFTDELAAALAGPMGATITSAVVTRSDDSELTFVFEGSNDGTNTFKVTARHTATSDETDYSGVIFGHFANGSNKNAFSVEYDRNASLLKARMTAGVWSGSSTDDDMFDDASRVDLGNTSSQNNRHHAILNYDIEGKVGAMSYAWMAGAGDSHARTFNVYVKGTDGSRTGCGFFGFGPAFVSDYANNTNGIDGMICNWAGPSNNHSMSSSSGKAQKQCFSESSGVFGVSSSSIRYWPNNSCNKGSTNTTPEQDTASGQTTNNLITLGSDSDFSSNWSAPSAP